MYHSHYSDQMFWFNFLRSVSSLTQQQSSGPRWTRGTPTGKSKRFNINEEMSSINRRISTCREWQTRSGRYDRKKHQPPPPHFTLHTSLTIRVHHTKSQNPSNTLCALDDDQRRQSSRISLVDTSRLDRRLSFI